MAYIAIVRYGKMTLTNKFKTDNFIEIKPKEKCIIKTDRGKEIGILLTKFDEIPELPPDGFGEILRKATNEDLEFAEKIEKENKTREMNFCKENIQKLQLTIKLIDVEHIFSGERIIFYFTSETRIDFRELVKILAQEFKTRIEMKQIGARDEAKLLSDCGHCGLTLCCKSFLKELGGVTMNMAKVQKHTADPAKITGKCGKLLCCLQYEFPIYTEFINMLPIVGVKITTQKGEGKVIDQNPLLKEVTIEKEGGEKVVVKLEEIVGSFETKATKKEVTPPEPETEDAIDWEKWL